MKNVNYSLEKVQEKGQKDKQILKGKSLTSGTIFSLFMWKAYLSVSAKC